ncbi:hypothetical protein DLNHIDIE_02518 [Acidithiobacillus thiooxidans ATCC 19377]|jgi:hypothetical protein|uniref:Uncharacterized protein n=1 Tax=Acidithiobacillus thiooxidans ATCC 19377 TaxID=637390 RepID=A0A543Q081_ACITH|nr:hypothetical protein DLNHIDIE_02518 [Acidithiobacillus thiooxidans ATCC 19377]
MLSLWGEIVIMVGTPLLLIIVAVGVNRLAKKHQQDEDRS